MSHETSKLSDESGDLLLLPSDDSFLNFSDEELNCDDEKEEEKNGDEENTSPPKERPNSSQSSVGGRREKNILTRLQTGSFSGPLKLLWECSRDGRRVRVWIRSLRSVHAICCGQLAAFDCHFNLAMINVDEVSVVRKGEGETGRRARKRRNRNRRRQRAAIARQAEKEEKDDPNSASSDKNNTKTDSKMHADKDIKSPFPLPKLKNKPCSEESHYRVVRRRHMPQLFIRGDEVLIISPVPEKTK